MKKVLRWAAIVSLMLGQSALGDEMPRETVLQDAQLRLQLSECLTLPLGKIHIRPYSEQARAKALSALEKAGIVSINGVNSSTGNVFQDLQSHLGREVGEGDLQIDLMPNLDSQQVQSRFRNMCLVTGQEVADVQLVSYDMADIKTNDMTTRKVIIAQGTYNEKGNLNSLYSAYLQQLGTSPIEHGKFRIMYVLDPFRGHWDFRGMDIGDVREASFRTNTIELWLSRLRSG